jgi:hypothetical protein
LPVAVLGSSSTNSTVLGTLCLASRSRTWARSRAFFERQWILHDFRQRVGMPVERCLEKLERMREHLAEGDLAGARAERAPLAKLAGFYDHLGDLARGSVKDARQRQEQVGVVAGWKAEVTRLEDETGPAAHET